MTDNVVAFTGLSPRTRELAKWIDHLNSAGADSEVSLGICFKAGCEERVDAFVLFIVPQPRSGGGIVSVRECWPICRTHADEWTGGERPEL